MSQTAGMPYRMTVSSLMQAEQHERIEGSIRKEIKLINDGFFCSELLALALKRLKLIDSSIAPNKYWPGNFSTENPATEIKLEGEAFYSEEFTLDLDLDFDTKSP